MIWKLLLTVAVILWGILVFRERRRRERELAGLLEPRPPLVPRAFMPWLAYGLLAVMLIGSIGYLVTGLRGDQDLVRVQVINANTGLVTEYLAPSRSIEGRRFLTSDGREVRLADVERLVIAPLTVPAD